MSESKTISSLLVANRGEIAIRIMRTARELGIRTVAVYSDGDRFSLHNEFADEARYIGPTPAADSYLNIEAVIEAAEGVDAIHPGYGFLAENSTFARAVQEAGHVWIGPPADAIEMMGDKIDARRAAERAHAQPVPGTTEPLTSPDDVREFADQHGLPLVIKASGGGGGRGMRVITDMEEIDSAFDSAAREVGAAFANTELYLERFLTRPRHIEAQIGVDNYGNGVFYGERDCSTQRRNQKLIEEAPATGLAVGVREVIAERALAIAAACGYRNLGTVEFLVSGDEVFFLEMNTRIQVEHAVTEQVTGIDLVAEQIRIASGERLEPGHRHVHGHAIEFRINAEDPFDGFRPTPGTITQYLEPAGPGIRVDSGVRAGRQVSEAYDNLISKLIVHSDTRDASIRRARRALDEYQIEGVPTTIEAHRLLIDIPAFVEARIHTQLVESEVEFDGPPAAQAAAAKAVEHRRLTTEIDGRLHHVDVWIPGAEPGSKRPPPMPDVSSLSDSSDGSVTAPMQGTIVSVEVKLGEKVTAGQVLCILEAMKMENEVASPVSGVIDSIAVSEGDTVIPGQLIAAISHAE